MKVFSHGSNVNFQISAREMFFTDLESLLKRKKEQSGRFVMGLLKPDKEQLVVYGLLTRYNLNDTEHTFELEDETIKWPQDQFLLSQEAVFTIEDERQGQVDYDILYLTYEDSEGESVLFFIDENNVTHPLACVVQFYEQVKEVGRDVDFSLTGCSANEWKPQK
ncbi:hypothetical protein MK805_01335 [Shimazuella sp. AN120528]|uniref:hypothetical protein n=1 Tax=Shimazuella soli TaxID=1892854 RepID=UPI001F0EF2E3|nr:hypothetical protein [Shimazuella soli]MCH5583614.1 hypothetical protein [Shimazuella soli]